MITTKINNKEVTITNARALTIALSKDENQATKKGYFANKFYNKQNRKDGNLDIYNHLKSEINDECTERYKNLLEMSSNNIKKFIKFAMLRRITSNNASIFKAYTKEKNGKYTLTFSTKDKHASFKTKLKNFFHRRKESRTITITDKEYSLLNKYIKNGNINIPAERNFSDILIEDKINEIDNHNESMQIISNNVKIKYTQNMQIDKSFIDKLINRLSRYLDITDKDKIEVASEKTDNNKQNDILKSTIVEITINNSTTDYIYKIKYKEHEKDNIFERSSVNFESISDFVISEDEAIELTEDVSDLLTKDISDFDIHEEDAVELTKDKYQNISYNQV